ncbi:N-acetylglucosamine malate deacetylase 2 [Candidatus Hakubella thermalkaliphila]|uniref:N-acetylglucosamine malate deacetylase 2 n=1 Tax=Candidatus Hakubella thermalkaliphila TaxID=2754717 RepID=A0A6V8Q8S3_9ACTN|nr:PIG-L deacetylase family protein [Candidatus Hakubella thermalkaliphila]GFP19556.1 N-acetylglucosamine malate deacetylase 2 [Candidatus Hakubella thermalkaliphila]GFP39321.1 N-acetylglucosamine malate deacetylase 2 [Candidatus Hakubella thermalkaliphila]GFP42077.1 N-acetylglucosamine malate deacetylase 2 [Candidatus Hakubella thermalkaliphila]
MGEKLSLLVAFAHPDDESYGSGGAIARYASEGVRVTLICATRGEASIRLNRIEGGPKRLAALREGELRQASQVLGIRDLRILGYGDGKLSQVDPYEAEGRIVKIIREVRPQVVLTFGPDGISGHPDHVAISRLTTAAFLSAGDTKKYSEHFQEGLAPYEPQKLYYTALPKFIAEVMEREDLQLFGYEDDQITTIIDITPYLETKMKAIYCHRGQGDYERFVERQNKGLLHKEYFHLTISRLGRRGSTEEDLFEGLR